MLKKIFFFFFIALLPAIAVAAEDNKAVIEQTYSIVHKHYVKKISFDEFAMLSLKSLNVVDKNVEIADDKKRVSFYYKSKLIRSFAKPKKDDAASWALFTRKVIKSAQKTSPTLKEHDYELADTILKEAVHKLDIHSKYQAGEDEPVEPKPMVRKVKGDILYLTIKEFNQNTANEIKSSIYPYTQAIIMDLRGNRGGVLADSLNVEKLFHDGGIIASVKTRSDNTTKYYNADEKDIFNGRPIVILVDGETASSAEIFAASMQELGRAKVIGTRTYGKGTVQNIYELNNGSTLALSTSYFYTPSGKEIDQKGLIPDICTSDMISLSDKSKCLRENRQGKQEDIEQALDVLKQSLEITNPLPVKE